ncbi:hypothetical protein CDAR_488481 [Caerostris darwini]|uniref:Uncharacterized protein n=1 Tax=Caerostris darwini TaxID=1538125 RepID=A0AAV4MB51_9ARAC|nr:hypothetical protein CDAR_488481 [Caerostris darwini]
MWEKMLYCYSDEPIWNVRPDDPFLYRNIIAMKCYIITRWLLTVLVMTLCIWHVIHQELMVSRPPVPGHKLHV